MHLPLEPSSSDLSTLEHLFAIGRPFTAATALAEGATYRMLHRFVAAGLLRHPVRGVYHPPSFADSLELRLEILGLVVPEGCVVTDRTAGWLWGANMILAPNDHVRTPSVQVFCPPGRRLRIGLVASGERSLPASDVAVIGGLAVTTPLRTACDLGRLLHRDQAFAALDSLAGLGRFSMDELSTAPFGFKGYRGVVQLRALVPFVDPRAESPGESILRIRWLDAGLPRPQCQVPVPAPGGGFYYLDIGLEERRFAAEYDGEAFHGDDRREHDDARRGWASDEHNWHIVVARKHHVHGPRQDIEQVLRQRWGDLPR